MTVNLDPGTTNTTTGLTGYQTYGNDMAGMTVTAWFSNGSSQTAVWAATGFSSGSASVGGWFSLSESGDTFGSNWTLTNTTNSPGLPSSTTLTRLLIDAGAGDTVFDTTFRGNEGTPGSASGRTFDLSSGPWGIDITATYRDAVALTGQSPVGDLYRRLELVFTDNGLYAGDSIRFMADTDNLKISGDLHPVPEPSSLVMAGVALLGATGVAMRRKAS